MWRQKYAQSLASPADFVHKTCYMKLYSTFGTAVIQQHHVRAKNILFDIHLQ